MKSKSQERQRLSRKVKLNKSTVTKLSKIHEKYNEIFEDDKVLLQELRNEINAQHRKAS